MIPPPPPSRATPAVLRAGLFALALCAFLLVLASFGVQENLEYGTDEMLRRFAHVEDAVVLGNPARSRGPLLAQPAASASAPSASTSSTPAAISSSVSSPTPSSASSSSVSSAPSSDPSFIERFLKRRKDRDGDGGRDRRGPGDD